MRRTEIVLAAALFVTMIASSNALAQRGKPKSGRIAPWESGITAKDDAEKKIIDILEDMYKNQSKGNMNVPTSDGRLLRLLTETTGAKHVVEVGTSNGYSGIWFCLALRKTDGKLTTYEIDAKRAKLARENFKRAGVEELVTLVEGDAHKGITNLKGPVDILFLDADKVGYPDYIEKILPLLRPGGLIIAHNTTSHGKHMDKYFDAVLEKPEFETFFLHVDSAGVGVTMKKY